jgi:hypothetical protein
VDTLQIIHLIVNIRSQTKGLGYIRVHRVPRLEAVDSWMLRRYYLRPHTIDQPLTMVVVQQSFSPNAEGAMVVIHVEIPRDLKKKRGW